MKRCIRILLIILLAFSMPYTYGGCVVVYSSGGIDRDKEKTVDETTGALTVDIDGDGDFDIVSIGWGHNRVAIYENPGDW